jgi:5-methylcytosine-specific restriction endonuclease McrA
VRRFSPQYLGYIRSAAWRGRRTAALIRAGHRCQVCGAKKRLEVHHVTYQNLGNERDEDLTVLCWQCHALNTWAIRARRWWAGFVKWLYT